MELHRCRAWFLFRHARIQPLIRPTLGRTATLITCRLVKHVVKARPIRRKGVYRLDRDERLAVRRRRRVARGIPLAAPGRINERWSLDFFLDTLEDGRRVRLLAVVDAFTPACSAIEVHASIGGRRGVEVLRLVSGTEGSMA